METRRASRRSERRAELRRSRLLVLEDDAFVTRFIETILRRAGFENLRCSAESGAIRELLREYRPDLIILDLHLRGGTGFEVMEVLDDELREDEYLPILVITGDQAEELRVQALELGAHDFLAKPFGATDLRLRAENLLETRLLHSKLHERNVALGLEVVERMHELEASEFELLHRLTEAVEVYDDATGQHTRRVGQGSARIAALLGRPEEEVELIRRAAPLHDVGKVGIPDALLLKEGPLTEAEFEVVKTHTVLGARILGGGTTPLVRWAEQIAHFHHERWDGSGYPEGLAGEAIPLAARIAALADFWDALRHDRPYRKAWPREMVVEEIRRSRGGHFDPWVVDAFLADLGASARE